MHTGVAMLLTTALAALAEAGGMATGVAANVAARLLGTIAGRISSKLPPKPAARAALMRALTSPAPPVPPAVTIDAILAFVARACGFACGLSTTVMLLPLALVASAIAKKPVSEQAQAFPSTTVVPLKSGVSDRSSSSGTRSPPSSKSSSPGRTPRTMAAARVASSAPSSTTLRRGLRVRTPSPSIPAASSAEYSRLPEQACPRPAKPRGVCRLLRFALLLLLTTCAGFTLIKLDVRAHVRDVREVGGAIRELVGDMALDVAKSAGLAGIVSGGGIGESEAVRGDADGESTRSKGLIEVHTSLGAVERLLAPNRSLLGADFRAYRMHVYRALSFALHFLHAEEPAAPAGAAGALGAAAAVPDTPGFVLLRGLLRRARPAEERMLIAWAVFYDLGHWVEHAALSSSPMLDSEAGGRPSAASSSGSGSSCAASVELSVAKAIDALSAQRANAEQLELVAAAIRNQHRLVPCAGPYARVVNAVRKAALVEFTSGRVRFGMSRANIATVKAKLPAARRGERASSMPAALYQLVRGATC